MKYDLNDEQMAVIKATEPFVLVRAAAGSGKTRCATARVEYLLDSGMDPNGMVSITFTNMAAGELKARLGEKAKGMFIGTVHAYANYLLVSHGINTKKYLADENFDALFKLIQDHPECIRNVEYLSLDEGQDSTELQLHFLFGLVKPKTWTIYFDIRQSIFRWAGACPNKLLEMSQNPNYKVYELRRNYRCGSNILNFAHNMIHLAGRDYDDNSICASNTLGKVLDVEYSPSALAKGIQEYNLLHQDEDWRDWFVLCRSNDDIHKFSETLKMQKIPYITFKQKDLTKKELEEKMEENAIKVLTIHSAKGLERKNVAIIGAKTFNLEEICLCYVAATRAERLLIWTRAPKKKKTYGFKMPVTPWE